MSMSGMVGICGTGRATVTFESESLTVESRCLRREVARRLVGQIVDQHRRLALHSPEGVRDVDVDDWAASLERRSRGTDQLRSFCRWPIGLAIRSAGSGSDELDRGPAAPRAPGSIHLIDIQMERAVAIAPVTDIDTWGVPCASGQGGCRPSRQSARHRDRPADQPVQAAR